MAEVTETTAAPAPVAALSVARAVGARYSMEPDALLQVLAGTVFPKKKDNVPATRNELTAFLAICYETGMNPFTREIFAYVAKSGNIEAIISVDGWLRKINEHPQYEGMEITEVNDEKTGKPISITAIAYRKDRTRHTPITEYYVECYRNTEPWNQMPHRMMRNKVIRQVARFTFGFAAATVDEDYLDEIHIGSGMSESLQKATESKAEDLKTKIGAAKIKKAEPPAPKNPDPEKPAANAASESEGTEPPESVATPSGTSEVEPSGAEAERESDPGPTGLDPEAKISKTDRESFVAILMAKKADQAVVVDATKKKLQEMGYKKTEEIKNKDLPAMVAWANKWQAPEGVSSL